MYKLLQELYCHDKKMVQNSGPKLAQKINQEIV